MSSTAEDGEKHKADHKTDLVYAVTYGQRGRNTDRFTKRCEKQKSKQLELDLVSSFFPPNSVSK